MVSTRFVNYSMAKTRSKSLPRVSLVKGSAIVLKHKTKERGTGNYRQRNYSPSLKLNPVVKSASPPKPSNAQIKEKMPRSNLVNFHSKAGKSRDYEISGKASSLKGKIMKKVSTVTKLVRPCKLGNKVNCALHKSNTKKANAGNKRGKKNKNQSEEMVENSVGHWTNGKSLSRPVTRNKSRTQVPSKGSSSTTPPPPPPPQYTTSVEIIRTASPSTNLSPVHTKEKHSTTVQITRMGSPRVRFSPLLSPVTFKKRCQFLKQEISQKQCYKDDFSIAKSELALENNENQKSEGNRNRKMSISRSKSEVNATISRARRSLSKSSLPQTNCSLLNQTPNELELMRASSIPNLMISNKTNVNVPNLDLSATRSLPSTTSTKKKRHSSSQNKASSTLLLNSTNPSLTKSVRTKSKSLESVFNSSTTPRKEYKTRRSCFLENILTRNLVKTSKYFNRNPITRKDVVETRRVRKKSRKYTKPAQDGDSAIHSKIRNDKDHTPVPIKTAKKSTQNNVSKPTPKTSAKEKERTKPEHENVVAFPKRQQGNQDSELHKKMIDLMTTKFGLRHTTPKKSKPNQKSNKQQKDLDDELVEIVDELAAVDSYVQAKIMSFKAQNNSVSADLVPALKTTVTSHPTLETLKQLQKHEREVSTKKRDRASDITRKSNNKERGVVKKLIDKTKSINKVNGIGKKSIDESNDIAKKSTDTLNDVSSENVGLTSTSNVDLIATDVLSNNKHNYRVSTKNINKNSHVDSTKTRTKLPLTLKSKIVMLKGKKVKKKLSQNERRIYNLLRCYGGSSTAPESPVHMENMCESDATGDNKGSSEIIKTNAHKGPKKGVQCDPKESVQLQLKDQDNVQLDTLECRAELPKQDSGIDKKCEERDERSSDQTGGARDGQGKTSRKQTKEKAKDKQTNGKDAKISNEATKKCANYKETREKCTNIGKKTKEYNSGKKENNASDASHHDGKDTCDGGSNLNKTRLLEKSVRPEDKEKRLQHKAKYNIAKEFKFSPSKVDTSYVIRKKLRRLRDSSSEDEWMDEDDDYEERRGHGEEIGGKNKKECKARREDGKSPYDTEKERIESCNERSHISNKESTPINSVKRNNQKRKALENKNKDTLNANAKSENKGVASKEKDKTSGDQSKENPRLTYNSSGADSSDNEFHEAYNEEDTMNENEDTTSRVNNNNTTATDMNDSDCFTDSSLLSKCRTHTQKQKKPIKRNSSSRHMNAGKIQRTDDSAAKTAKTGNFVKTRVVQIALSEAEKIKLKHEKKFKKVLAGKDYASYCKNSEDKKHGASVRDARRALTNNTSPTNVSDQNSSPDISSSNNLAANSSNSFVEQLSDGIVLSDEDIFDDPVDERPLTKQAPSANSSVNSSLNSSGNSGANSKVTSPTDASKYNQRNSEVGKEKKIEFKEIVNEHVNKYKTKDLVENLKQWTDMENEMKMRRSSSRSSKEKDVGNYRDYTTRLGVAPNPVRILKKKACEDLKRQMKNKLKNGCNEKDYFQCMCFNKFFITRVRNTSIGHFDILNVKVKPNKSENVVSISDVEFCTLCSRLYDKYKDNLILINQEYIINEFIRRHSNDWNKLNKSYDNDVSLMSPSNLAESCNLSFVSTATGESHTGSRLDSMSSDRTLGSDYSDYYLNEIFLKKAREDSKLASSHEFARLKQKCRHVNLRINELCDVYKASPRRISSTETRSNVTDETLDDGVFTRPTPRQGTSLLSDHSNPSRSLLEVSIKQTKTPCKSIASQTSPDERDVKEMDTPRREKYVDGSRNQSYGQFLADSGRFPCTPRSGRYANYSEHYPCTPRRSRHHDPDSDSMVEGDHYQTLCLPTKQTATPNSFTCSRTPNSMRGSPRRKDNLFRRKIEKTKDSFDCLFKKVWRKCSPAAQHRKRGREYADDDDCLNSSFRRNKKPRQSGLGPSRRSQLKRLNQSQLSTDFSNDEYDADFSDSDGNGDASTSVSGNNMVEHRRHFVNKLFIKQSSSRQLFTNKKTSYSDSEQVIKIKNVNKKVYTTIQRKVYRTQTSQDESKRQLNAKDGIVTHSNKSNKRNRKQVNATNCCLSNKSERSRNWNDLTSIADETSMNSDTSKHSMDETAFHSSAKMESIINNKTSYLQDKIQQIQYSNLWSKLTERGDQSDSPLYRNTNQTRGRDMDGGSPRKGDTDSSDIMIEQVDERRSSTRIDNATKRNYEVIKESTKLSKDTRDLSAGEESGTRVMSPDTTNEFLTSENTTQMMEGIVNEENHSSFNLMNDILVQKMTKLNTYEYTKEQVEKYANAVNQNIEPLNKTYVLKLLKKLMKCRQVLFDDYANVLNKLKINLNVNDKDEILIKHESRCYEQDELIMKRCYDKLHARYHKKKSVELNTHLGLCTSGDTVENEPSQSTQALVEDPVDSFESFKADLNRNEVEINEKISGDDKGELEVNSVNEIILDNDTEDVVSIDLTGNGIDKLNVTIPLNQIDIDMNEDTLAQDLLHVR